jgi:hypothetical protein
MIASLDDAWHWYEAVRVLVRSMERLGEKHWDKLPWDGELGRDNRLKELVDSQIVEMSATVLGDVDDFCVLLLFSVFESIVRERVRKDVAQEVPPFKHPALIRAIQDLDSSIEQGSFFRVLEPYKGLDADLVEEVNQVRRYRNWVAHGRRGEQPNSVDPHTAFERLQRFLDIPWSSPPLAAS